MMRMLRRWLILLPLLLPALKACDQAKSGLDIVGGEAAEAPPYFAALHEWGGKGPFCGGTLIARDVILTAAHCVSGLAGPLGVWLGVSDLQELPEPISVEAIRVHPQYHNRRYQHDLALLYIKDSTAPTARISHAAKSDQPLHILGFGNTSVQGHVYPQLLQAAVVNEFPAYACQSLGGPYQFVLEEQICASAPAADSCDGDSGGPLLLNGELYGIVSWGTGCGDSTQPGVYTRAGAYKEWIEEQKQAAFPIDELAYAVFYFPLIHGDRQFTAGYHLWKEEPQASPQEALQTWTRSFRSRSYSLRLLQSGPQRYRLEFHADGRVYSTPTSFSSRP